MNTRSVSDQTAQRSAAPISPTPGNASTDTSGGGGFYYGSVDAIPTATAPMHALSPNPNVSASHRVHSVAQSLQPQYLSHHPHDIPPYARGGSKGRATSTGVRRRHGRTSSSLSSSYTRSSVRGGADDEDEDDEDDGMDDVGYLSPVSPVYGSATSGIGLNLQNLALSPNLDALHVGAIGMEKGSQATIRRRRVVARDDDLDFDVLYERDEAAGDGDGEEADDTVDEESTDDRNHQTADVGMEIDMDL